MSSATMLGIPISTERHDAVMRSVANRIRTRTPRGYISITNTESIYLGGMSELVADDAGVLARPVSADSLTEALEEALLRRDFCRSSIKARAAVHAPAVVWGKYHSVYTKLLAG